MKTRSGSTPRSRFSPYFRRKKASSTKDKKLTSQHKKQLDNISTSLNNKFNCVKAEYVVGTLSDSSSDSNADDDSNTQNQSLSQSGDSTGGSTSLTITAKSSKNSVIKDERNPPIETSVPKHTTDRTAKARKIVKQPMTKQAKRGKPLKNLRSKLKVASQELAEEKAILDPKLSKDSRNQISSDMEYTEQLSDEPSSSDDDFVIRKSKRSTKMKRKANTGNHSKVKNTYSRSGSTRKSNTKSKQLHATTVAINTAHDSDGNKSDNIVNGSDAITSSSIMRDGANESDSDIEWEDVGHVCHEVDLNEIEKLHENSLNEPTVEAPVNQEKKTIEIDLAPKKKQRAENYAHKYLMRMINRFNKDLRMNVHKVHTLLLMASGFHRNRLTRKPLIKAIFLSLIPTEFLSIKPAKWNIANITNCLNWYRDTFAMDRNYRLPASTVEELVRRLESKKVSVQDYVHGFIAVMRTLAVPTRLVISLKVISFKELKAETSIVETTSVAAEKTSTPDKSTASEIVPKEDQLDIAALLRSDSDDEPRAKPLVKAPAKRRLRKPKASTSKATKVKKETKLTATGRPSRKCTTKIKNLKDESEDEAVDNSNDSDFVEPVSSDSDFIEQMKFKLKIVRRKQKPDESKDKVVKKVSKLKKRKSIDTDTNSNTCDDLISPVNSWIEVYLKSDKRWICCDCINNNVDQPNLMENTATKPLTYVVAFDDNDKMRDLTSRYANRWLIYNRKLRPDQSWWDETIASYESSDKKGNKREDEELLENLRQKPMPTNLTEFKNHPLYVLRRHLLKYEVIYPEDTEAIGEIRGEAILPRENVYTLHTSESWFIKHGRSIKKGEEPIKSTPARIFNPNKIAAMGAATKMNDLYGIWQTELYRPPRAKNGKVPRNEYGNVEVFFPHMIPPGTVHMKIPNLNRIAQKLKIDCASVVTGWDYHRGHVYPVTNGYLVCCEFEEVLLDAVRQEEMEERKRCRMMKEEQILKRWKKLIKGLLIREKLHEKYNLDSKSASLKSYKRKRLLKHKKETL